MIAFVILSSFDFYRICGMLQRMESMSNDITRMTKLMEKTVPMLAADIHQMAETMPELEQYVSSLTDEITTISFSTSSMATSTQHMGVE